MIASIKTILFDFDGTLADTMPLLVDCMNALAGEYGYERVEDPAMLREQSMRRMVKERLPLYKIPRAVRKVKRLLRAQSERVVFFQDVKAVLEELSESYVLGILTSNSSEIVEQALDREEVDCISFVHSDSPLFGKHKRMKKLIKRYRLQAGETIYVGDEVTDVEACKKAGLPIIAVTWGFNTRCALEIENPEFLADCPRDILGIFNNA